MNSLEVSLLEEGEIDALKILAEKIWRQTYTEIISNEQIAYMLELIYEDNRIRQQMASGNPVFVARAGDDPAKLDPRDLRDACVIHGSPETVARKILALREEVGEFGTLLYAAHDWQDKARMQKSMRLMAQEVMPRVNAALRNKAA